ncbi:MAG: hypothetical protein ACK595_15555 [Planctomycetota bacterium]
MRGAEAGGRISDWQDGDDWLFGDRVLASNGHLHGALRRLLGSAG